MIIPCTQRKTRHEWEYQYPLQKLPWDRNPRDLRTVRCLHARLTRSPRQSSTRPSPLPPRSPPTSGLLPYQRRETPLPPPPGEDAPTLTSHFSARSSSSPSTNPM